MRYLYIFEDGTIAIGDDPPTAEDLRAIGDGILEVVRIAGYACGLDDDGATYELPGVVTRKVNGVEYHSLEPVI